MCACVALYLFSFLFWEGGGGCFVFLSFDGSETLIKINIIGFQLHPTNWVSFFFSRVLRSSHSSPGMFGIGSLLPFPKSDSPRPPPPPHPPFPSMNSYSKAQQSLFASPPPRPAPLQHPSPFFTLLCHLSFTSHNIHYITLITRHCHTKLFQSLDRKT